VRCAYLELTAPDLPAVARLMAAGATGHAWCRMFLGTGKHAREDLPALVAQPAAPTRRAV
jgi:sirohydrochlorin cobaltochelatase